MALCHYFLVSWNRKNYGACMIHGHCHGRVDDYNIKTGDLRVDVGIDGKLARECGGFIPLKLIEIIRKHKKGLEQEILVKLL